MASIWQGYAPATSLRSPIESSSHASKKKPQPRQLLSCTKCRERKVKCDRTKPCAACCARGFPKECEFIVGEGNDYSPIPQSYEIRKLRVEVQRLRERLRLNASGDDSDDEESPERANSKASTRAAAARQRRFKTGDRSENLYFGTPGLANIISDFANLNLGNHSLTHTVPKARDIYRMEASMYPFHILRSWDDTSKLLAVLPDLEELLICIDMYQRRANATSFPHMPAEDLSKTEIERFLADAEVNAKTHPDMLALVFAMLATGMQVGVWDRLGGQWSAGEVVKAISQADVYLAASMQALRLASFMNQPTLLGIETLLLMGPYLTNSGRFLDAWTLFGTTIRLAHSIGLHRNPKYLDPAPPLRESTTRQTLWWWMLHMDQHYSVTLGRPLGISGIGDCPLPEPLTTDPTTLRLGEFVNHFTVLARQILGSDGMMSVSKIDEFTDKLMGLWDTMPESLQFNESWPRAETTLPEWPLGSMSASLFAKVQSFIVLLNRQRQERTMHTSNSPSSNSSLARSNSQSTPATYYNAEQQHLHPAPIRGRALVINSSISLLQTFLFFYHREAAVLICWTLAQQAFNACMILILDAYETNNYHNEWLLNQAYGVFVHLDRCGVHSLANMAVKRISDGLDQLTVRKQEYETNEISRGSSITTQKVDMTYPMELTLDTSLMVDLSNEQVMGNTGMYLLEDGGLQGHQQMLFQPFGWDSPDSIGLGASINPAHSTRQSSPAPQIPTVPVSNVPIAPFPVMAPPYIPSTATLPATNSPFAIGLQPRMPQYHHIPTRKSSLYNGRTMGRTRVGSAFPSNAQMMHNIDVTHMQNHHFLTQHSNVRSAQSTCGADDLIRTTHREGRTPKSQQRRSVHRR